MCGIAGLFYFEKGRMVEPRLLQEMALSMRHRGPDESGIRVFEGGGFAHARLRILDLSSSGKQPMATEDGDVCVVFNGEIYNFYLLKESLKKKGVRFNSTTDTEVLLYLYREKGVELLEDLNGMFAFAIYDRKRKLLFIARDRVGKKPLYYYMDREKFIFASEIKPIKKVPDTDLSIRKESILDYFYYLYIPDPSTIYEKVSKLLPGHYLLLDLETGKMRISEYWDFPFIEEEKAKGTHTKPVWVDEGVLVEELEELLVDSVRLRLISDVPLGAFLSGGLDSSLVVSLMSEISDKPVKTFNIGFMEEEVDESRWAEKVAKSKGTVHEKFVVQPLNTDVIEKVGSWFDEPFADSSALPTYYLSMRTRRHVTVALSGDGGDENFAGYDKYKIDCIEERARRAIPSLLMPLLSRCADLYPDFKFVPRFMRFKHLLKNISTTSDKSFFRTNTFFSPELTSLIIREELLESLKDYDPSHYTIKYFRRFPSLPFLSRALYTDLKTYLPFDILTKVDRMSMAHSLEVRAPLLDYRILNWTSRLPHVFKLKGFTSKYLLKRVAKRHLPLDIVRRRKHGFEVPLDVWFRYGLKRFFVEKTIEATPSSTAFDYIRIDGVKRLFHEHTRGIKNHGTTLWAILVFFLWIERG